MTHARMRRSVVVALLGVIAAACSACSSSTAARPQASSSTVAPTVASSTIMTPSASGKAISTPTTAPATSRVDPPPAARLHAHKDQLTPQGMWWGVDSTAPISSSTLANVRSYYRGRPHPLVWGRYLSGSFALRPGELAFARAHGIAIYLIVPDDNCSGCGGGDACGNDRTARQARTDARESVRAATKAHIPDRATLFKDIEQVGSCSGELTGDYLTAWYRYVRTTSYRVGFYGNTNRQSYDFPRAYCAAVKADSAFGSDVVLAQDEPEPDISAPPGTIGPRTAPSFQPYVPRCAPKAATRIWQYGESTSSDNSTDVDEIKPGTHGLLAPDGSVT